ncbi:MAG: response regulator [Rhodothermales bacterium]
MSTILVIEDDHNLLEGLVLFLQMRGYATLSTTNGRTGLEIIRRQRPDVIVTNLQMPGADGLEVLHTVRSDAALSHTPVVFITADHKPSVRQQAIHAGAAAYLTKPFTPEDLAETILHLLEETNHQQLT